MTNALANVFNWPCPITIRLLIMRISLNLLCELGSGTHRNCVCLEQEFKGIGMYNMYIILAHRPLPEHSRRLLVLLNPFSGQRKALQLWRQEVEPVWREAGFQIELAVTERAGHATEMMATVDLDRVGMLALGG